MFPSFFEMNREILLEPGENSFFSVDLQEKMVSETVSIFYHPNNKQIAEDILKNERKHIMFLNQFYKVNLSPEIIFFLYPSKESMEEAFKRPLPHAQCCFVPIKGDVSLVTLTALISSKSLNQIMIHETSHIFFHILTGNYEVDNISQVMPLWLEEGLALYLDSRYREDMQKIIANRLKMLNENNTDYFPDLMDLYTYFNRLDEHQEFGPKGQMAYAYSFFCVTRLIYSYGIDNVVTFIKALDPEKNINEMFFSFFKLPLSHFNETIKKLVLNADERMVENFYKENFKNVD